MKKEVHKNRNLLIGIFLVILTTGILATVGFSLAKKYSQPPSLAKLLPNEDTLLFAELRLNEETPQLAQLFAGIPGSQILELKDLGLANSAEELLAFAKNRIGVAFFGENVNSQNFALILDFVERDEVLKFFEKQTLADEELKTQNFLHQKIYYFPRSHPLAFMFVGQDLILGSDLKILQKIATAIHVPEKRIANGADFRAVIAKLNPRANFIYFSPHFANAFFESRFAGMERVFATPLLNLWSGGGANFAANNENGLKIQTRLILKNNFVRRPLFLETKNFDLKLLNFFGEEAQSFFASNQLNSQLTHFLEATANENSPLFALTKSWLGGNVQTWLGGNFTTEDLSPLWENANAVGVSTSGGLIGIFEGEFDQLLEKLKTVNGKLAATEKIVELPDTTPGRELVVEKFSTVEENLFASHKITSLKFPNYELNFAKLDNFLIITSERDVLEKIIAHFVAEEKAFGDLAERSGITSGNIFYSRIENAEIPLLRPFRFAIVGINAETDGVRIDSFLGK
jgi:hypothetical protein